jgi:type III secretion system low calcium response chaperone LcrH/SycD
MESQEDIYASGYALYEGGKYREACDCFRVLTTEEPKEFRFWMGLGASHQMLAEYDLALQAYAAAATLNPLNPYTHLHAAECFWALGKKREAQEALCSSKQTATEPHIINKLEVIQETWR